MKITTCLTLILFISWLKLSGECTLTATDSVTNATSCNPCNAAATVFASGGTEPYQYLWYGPENSVATGDYTEAGPTQTQLCTGFYYVWVLDAYGCYAQVGFNIINVHDSLVFDMTSSDEEVTCTHPDTMVLSDGGSQQPCIYNWGDGHIDSGVIAPATHYYYEGGQFNVQITDTLGCTYYIWDSIYNDRISLYSNVEQPHCPGNYLGYIAIDGVYASSAVTYLWSNGATTDSIGGLTGGSYSVTVTDTSGCSVSETWVIPQYSVEPGFFVFVSWARTNCADSATLLGQAIGGMPPYSYLWNTSPAQTDSFATGLSAGNYSLTVTDSVGCKIAGNGNVYTFCGTYVEGLLYIDSNCNCIPDSGEEALGQKLVELDGPGGPYYGNTDSNGHYFIAVSDTGYYNLGLTYYSGCVVPSCPAQQLHIRTYGDTLFNYNLGFSNNPGFDITLYPGWSAASPGFQKDYWIFIYSNIVIPYTGPDTVTFVYDSNLTYLNGGYPQPVNNALTHTLTWTMDTTLPSWPPLELTCNFMVPVSLSPSYLLQSSFLITPTAGDCNPYNNFYSNSSPCGGAQDPNEKTVTPSGSIAEADSVLTYTINFQNTGAAQTHFIIVTDTLSPYLNPASVTNVASSNTFSSFTISGKGILTWIFKPIYLTPASSNADSSKGFITFTVHRFSDAPIGTEINNTASIYFDYNPVVVTNTVTDTIGNASFIFGPSSSAGVCVKAFPNPFDEVTNIAVSGINEKFNFELYDLTGRLLSTITNEENNIFQLHRNGLAAGVYLYRLTDAKGVLAYGKLAVQ